MGNGRRNQSDALFDAAPSGALDLCVRDFGICISRTKSKIKTLSSSSDVSLDGLWCLQLCAAKRTEQHSLLMKLPFVAIPSFVKQ